MSMNAEEKMITLKSRDGGECVVAEVVARMSKQIRRMIEDNCANDIIPLPNVTSKLLSKAIEYCKMHVYKKQDANLDTAPNESGRPLSEADMDKWDTEFINVDQGMLFDLILAADYLEIDGLFKLTCNSVAQQMNGKTPEEIRKHFHIVNDYTPEEEEEIRRELSWAFD